MKNIVEFAMNQVEELIKLGEDRISFVDGPMADVEKDSRIIKGNYNGQWNINFDAPIITHRFLYARIVIFIKRAIRKTIGWYVKSFFLQQRAFNASIVQFLNILDEDMHRKDELIDLLRREIQSLKTEISSLESTVNTRKRGLGERYLKFEDDFRGSRELIKGFFREFVPFLAGPGIVYDLGCGRGEMLELLQEANIECVGIDSNPAMVKLCLALNLPAVLEDIGDYVSRLKDNTAGGFFISQVVEHLEVYELTDLLEETHAKLAPGSPLIIETPNPLTVLVSSNTFHLDLTHKLLVHPDTLVHMLKTIGFTEIETKFRHPFPKEDTFQDGTDDDTSPLILKLNHLLYGPRDYAVIARKGVNLS